jgi:hypothetical protein
LQIAFKLYYDPLIRVLGFQNFIGGNQTEHHFVTKLPSVGIYLGCLHHNQIAKKFVDQCVSDYLGLPNIKISRGGRLPGLTR